MIYRVSHTTTYLYSEPVSLCHNLIHLKARNSPQQTCLQSQLLIQPLPAITVGRVDYFGNPATFTTIQESHQKLMVTAVNLAQLAPRPPVPPALTPPWEQVRHLLSSNRSPEILDAFQFAFDSPYIKIDAELGAYAAASFTPGRPILEAALDLTRRIHGDFRYDRTATSIATPLNQVLELRRGVCQDFAHLQIGCLRSLGLAARYVSGYLRTNPPPGQPRLVGADASHAWVSFFCPGFGWLDVDPTNNQMPADQHIVLAWGRDYDDVSPIKGVILGGGQHSVSVSVSVVPVSGQGDRGA